MKFGKAFSDSLIIGESRTRPGRDDPTPTWWQGRGRALLFATTLSVSMFILLWRLFSLTVTNGHRYRVLADDNRTRELIRHAPRGILRDRTGKPLVENVPQYRLITPCEGVTNSGCTKTLTTAEGEAVSSAGLAPGQYLEVDYARRYLGGSALAHVVGYTGELTDAELSDEYYQLRRYRSGDRIGRMGAEAVYEDKLRGRDGRELVEVDANGHILRSLGRDQERPGEDVTLSLDGELSSVVGQSFPDGMRGAVIVAKPDTGEMLAMYSSPSYDPNGFSFGMSNDQYDKLLGDANQPMFDRAIGGAYPPGSTFKIVTALAALQEGAVTPETTVEDTGVITIGPYSYPNWYFTQYGRKEGSVDIVGAIQRSNDIYFYKAGEFLGIDKLASWARRIGLGKPLGIQLNGEAAGLMPDPAWKKEHFTSPADRQARNQLWFLGDTYHVAIGQGFLLTSPLQVNAWTNVIANGGKLCRPTIKKSSNDCKDLGIKKETITLITEGIKKACEPGGTGWPLFNFVVPVACKTGTAEFGDPEGKTHAWFTVFGPVTEPEISVTVLVEAGGEGSNVAAPIAKKILEAWFSR